MAQAPPFGQAAGTKKPAMKAGKKLGASHRLLAAAPRLNLSDLAI
jgi:hypothetical protein